MSLSRRVATNSLMLMLAQGSGRILGLLALPLMTQFFAPEAFGTAALATTFMALLGVVALMGMDLSYTRAYLGERGGRADEVEAYAWRFALRSGGLAALVGAGVWWAWGRQVPSAAAWVGIGALFSVLLPIAQARTRLHGDYRRLAAGIAAGTVFTVAASLAAGWLSWQSGVALIAATVAGLVVTTLILGWPTRSSLLHLQLAVEQRKAILAIGMPAAITAPMYWLITSADRWFLVHFLGNAEAGVYAVAATIGSAGALFNTAVAAVWMPEATRLHETEGEAAAGALGQLMSRIILAMALGWLLTTGLAGEAVGLLTAPPFHAAARQVPWLAGAVFFVGVYHVASTGLVLGRRLGPTTLIWLAAAMLAVVLSLLFVPTHGAMASARIQCLCMALTAGLITGLAAKRHPIPLRVMRLFCALALVFIAAIGIAPAWHSQPWVSLLLKLPCLLVLAVLIAWIGDPGLIRHLKSRLSTV